MACDFASRLELLADTDFDALSKEQEFEDARRRALTAVRRLRQRLESPLEMSRRIGWQEPAYVAAIKIALNLGLFEELRKHDIKNGVEVSDLAKSTNASQELVVRIMRHLAAWGVVHEIDAGRYAASAMSNAFLDPKVSSGLDFWIDLSALGFRNLPQYLQTVGYEKIAVPGKGNWEQVSGSEKQIFLWMTEHPDVMNSFANHMAGFMGTL